MSRDRDREKKRDQEDEEDAYERRKLERKLRDKEAAYQEVGKAGRLPGLSPKSLPISALYISGSLQRNNITLLAWCDGT